MSAHEDVVIGNNRPPSSPDAHSVHSADDVKLSISGKTTSPRRTRDNPLNSDTDEDQLNTVRCRLHNITEELETIQRQHSDRQTAVNVCRVQNNVIIILPLSTLDK